MVFNFGEQLKRIEIEKAFKQVDGSSRQSTLRKKKKVKRLKKKRKNSELLYSSDQPAQLVMTNIENSFEMHPDDDEIINSFNLG